MEGATAPDVSPAIAAADLADRVVAGLATVMHAPVETLRLPLLCLLAEGHVLVEDVPGVGKTVLAKALARTLDLRFSRLQFTPDLLPSDVTGVNVYDQQEGRFRFRPGPVFANVLLVDEVNRASPKTQSALLEAMQETQVTVDGETYELDRPFLAIATQNPLEYEGTYPLPEAQLDRFAVRMSIGYPPLSEEARMLSEQTGEPPLDALEPVAGHAEIVDADRGRARASSWRRASRATSSRSSGIRGRTGSWRSAPAHARASRCSASRRRALSSNGATYVTPEDIREMAEPVLCSPSAAGARGTLGGARACRRRARGARRHARAGVRRGSSGTIALGLAALVASWAFGSTPWPSWGSGFVLCRPARPAWARAARGARSSSSAGSCPASGSRERPRRRGPGPAPATPLGRRDRRSGSASAASSARRGCSLARRRSSSRSSPAAGTGSSPCRWC